MMMRADRSKTGLALTSALGYPKTLVGDFFGFRDPMIDAFMPVIEMRLFCQSAYVENCSSDIVRFARPLRFAAVSMTSSIR
jgi:hypothetical protein